MPSLNLNEKLICEDCCTQITKLNPPRHKMKPSAGTLYCTQCLNSSTKSQNELNHQFAETHSAPKFDVTFKCNICCQDFSGF